MPSFDPELIQVMRSALDEGMTKVPAEYSTIEVKTRLAEFILKAAAHGQINLTGLWPRPPTRLMQLWDFSPEAAMQDRLESEQEEKSGTAV